jgi:hypothetical protein
MECTMSDTETTVTTEVAEPVTTEEREATAALEDDDQPLEDMEGEATDEDDAAADSAGTDADTADDDGFDTETDEEADTAEEESADKPDSSSDETTMKAEAERKRYNDEMAQRRIAEKRVRQQAKAEAQAEYLDNAEDQRDLALRQLQIEAYNTKVERTTSKLESSLDRAIADIDLFREQNPVIQKHLARVLDSFEDRYVVKDRNGDAVEVKDSMDLYEYLQEEAATIRELTGIGAKQQQTAKANQKARAVATPSRSPKKAKSDPMTDGFDEEANR